MMARYINVDDFFQDHEPLLTWELIDAMNKSVAEDVAPVKHGKWDEDTDDWIYKCSLCGEWVSIDAYSRFQSCKYCMNCGARMDEEKG